MAPDFINNSNIQLLGYGAKSSSIKETNHFILSDFLIVYHKKGVMDICHQNEHLILLPETFYIFRPYVIYHGIRTSSCNIEFSYLSYNISPFIEKYNFEKIALYSADHIFKQKNTKHLASC